MGVDVAAELPAAASFCNPFPAGVVFGGIWDAHALGVSWEGQHGDPPSLLTARGVLERFGEEMCLPRRPPKRYLLVPSLGLSHKTPLCARRKGRCSNPKVTQAGETWSGALSDFLPPNAASLCQTFTPCASQKYNRPTVNFCTKCSKNCLSCAKARLITPIPYKDKTNRVLTARCKH